MKQGVGPKIDKRAKEFICRVFSSANAGSTYILESFKRTYEETLKEMQGLFTKNQLLLIVDVFNGHMLNPVIAGDELRMTCTESIKYDHMDEKWSIDVDSFISKIEKLTVYQRTSLEIWANAFWYGGDLEEDKNLEKYVEELL